MDRLIAIKRLKRILEVKNENLDMYDKEALKMALASLETDETYQLEYEPTTKNDLALIHTEGLDEEIRCTMCTNSMKSDRGCDGSCVVNNDMYKAVMDAIEKRIQPTTNNDLGVDCVARQDIERYIEGFINEYTPKEELEFINLELDGLKHLPSVTPQEPRKRTMQLAIDNKKQKEFAHEITKKFSFEELALFMYENSCEYCQKQHNCMGNATPQDCAQNIRQKFEKVYKAESEGI